MKNLIAVALLIASFLNSTIVWAQQAGISDEQNRIIQLQQQRERESLRQQELQKIESEKNQIITPKIEQKIVAKDNKCYVITKIIIKKNTIISEVQNKRLTSVYLNKCLTVQQISQLANEINDYLARRGFVTSKAIIANDNFTEGIVIIKIIEGKLEDFVFNDDVLLDKMQKFSAFGFVKKNEVLNIEDYESGLDQINRLASNHAVIKIFPGVQADSSIMAIQNKPQDRLRINLSYDDLGAVSTGKNRDTVTILMDNLLYLNDSLVLSRSGNDLARKKEQGRSESYSLSFSVPLSNHLLSFYGSHYSYLMRKQLNGEPAYGESKTLSFTLDSILWRNKKYKLTSNLNLTARDNKNYLGEVKQIDSSQKATFSSIGLSNIFYFDKSHLLLKPSYNKGLRLLNAAKDNPNATSDKGHRQFDILKFYANYVHNIDIKSLQMPFSYSLTLDSQIAKQRLYSNDQFFVGGPYTVRGFENGSIAGDSGYNIKNELRFNLGNLALRMADPEKNPNFFKWINHFSIAPFYDYGYVRRRTGQASGRISGAGIKTSFIHKNLIANLSYAWVVNKSLLLNEKYQENQAIYFDVMAEIGFF